MEIPLFRPVKVFDVSQTDGKPLPSLAADLFGNVRHFEAFMEALKRSAPVPFAFEEMDARYGRIFFFQRAAHRHPPGHERGADGFRRCP